MDPSEVVDTMDQASDTIILATPYRGDGSGVVVFVIDTGIHITHAESRGRSWCDFNAVEYEDCIDLNGHGSHVAGTIGGATFGVAKNVQIRGVKVLDSNGGGSYAGVLAGMDHVLGAKAAHAHVPMVMNMSLGGVKSTLVNDALKACVDGGIVSVVAAGNESTDACFMSPASAKSAVTVGATSAGDKFASFSNRGECVDILAPGEDIMSASIRDDYSFRMLSGTSMAAPHVAGAAALYLQRYPKHTPAQVTKALIDGATKDVIAWVYPQAGTPNLLLNTKSLGL